jgi:hypothetical protein
MLDLHSSMSADLFKIEREAVLTNQHRFWIPRPRSRETVRRTRLSGRFSYQRSDHTSNDTPAILAAARSLCTAIVLFC